MLITGFHAIEEAIRCKRSGVLFLSAKNPRTLLLDQLARKAKMRVQYISCQEMRKLSGQESIKAILKTFSSHKVKDNKQTEISLKNYLENWKERNNLLVLILDGITDVHNFGAILRSAHMFNVDLVIIPKHNSASLNEAVYRTSSGACEYVPLFVSSNLCQSIELLKKENFWVYSTDTQGKTISEENFAQLRVAVIMGSEAKGPRHLTRQISDDTLTIPCHGKIDSLNVSVATGIILYEIRKQQLFYK